MNIFMIIWMASIGICGAVATHRKTSFMKAVLYGVLFGAFGIVLSAVSINGKLNEKLDRKFLFDDTEELPFPWDKITEYY